MIRKDYFVSVVALMHNDADVLHDFISEVVEILQKHFAFYELVLVDNGSRDSTRNDIENELKKKAGIRYIRLSREYDEEIAIGAAIDTVIGDVVVILSLHTDPPHLLPSLIEKAFQSKRSIIGVAKNEYLRYGFFAHVFLKFFRWYCARFLKFNQHPYATSLRVLSRREVNFLTHMKEKHRSVHLLDLYTGIPSEYFSYQTINRKNTYTSSPFIGVLRKCRNIIVSNSYYPLRLVIYTAIGAAILDFLYVLYIIFIYFFKNKVVEGWTTTSMQISVLFFLLFLLIIVLAEYLGKIIRDGNGQPAYYLIEEKSSVVSTAYEQTLNIVKDSL